LIGKLSVETIGVKLEIYQSIAIVDLYSISRNIVNPRMPAISVPASLLIREVSKDTSCCRSCRKWENLKLYRVRPVDFIDCPTDALHHRMESPDTFVTSLANVDEITSSKAPESIKNNLGSESFTRVGIRRS